MMNKLSRLNQASLASNPRATFAAWQKYEPIVLAAYKEYPKPFIWSPLPYNMSCDTIVSRIRDAIRGKLAFDYPSPISTDDLLSWYDMIVVKKVDNNLFIGLRNFKGESESLPFKVQRKEEYVFDTLTDEEIHAFALLLSTSRIFGPIIVRKPTIHINSLNYTNFTTFLHADGSLVLL